jgi:hypothetical protein
MLALSAVGTVPLNSPTVSEESCHADSAHDHPGSIALISNAHNTRILFRVRDMTETPPVVKRTLVASIYFA